MKLRWIEENDIHACLDLYNWYIENTLITFETELLSLPEFRDRVHAVTERYPWIVLEEEGVILGYAYLAPFNPRAAYRFTADVSIYLDQNCRGRGYGTLMMKELEEIALKDGFYKLVSLITEGNEASEHMFERLGYQKEVLLKNAGYKFNRWAGVSWYVKDLKDHDDHPAEPVNCPYEEKIV